MTARYMRFMFGISASHLILLAIVLLIFGPKRLPELGRTMGKALRNFKDALSGVEEAKFTRLGEGGADSQTEARPAEDTDGEPERTPPAGSRSRSS